MVDDDERKDFKKGWISRWKASWEIFSVCLASLRPSRTHRMYSSSLSIAASFMSRISDVVDSTDISERRDAALTDLCL